jgi:protein-disulfide isomerase-like protein with CxxC motif
LGKVIAAAYPALSRSSLRFLGKISRPRYARLVFFRKTLTKPAAAIGLAHEKRTIFFNDSQKTKKMKTTILKSFVRRLYVSPCWQ